VAALDADQAGIDRPLQVVGEQRLPDAEQRHLLALAHRLGVASQGVEHPDARAAPSRLSFSRLEGFQAPGLAAETVTLRIANIESDRSIQTHDRDALYLAAVDPERAVEFDETPEGTPFASTRAEPSSAS
jgi:hypothetical protein